MQDALFWSTTVPSASLVLNLDMMLRKMVMVRFRRIMMMTKVTKSRLSELESWQK